MHTFHVISVVSLDPLGLVWINIHYEYRDLYINNTNTNWLGYKANHLGISKCRPVKLITAPLLHSWYNELHTVTHCLEHASLITRLHVGVSEHRFITRTDCIQHSQRLFNMCIHQVIHQVDFGSSGCHYYDYCSMTRFTTTVYYKLNYHWCVRVKTLMWSIYLNRPCASCITSNANHLTSNQIKHL